MPIIEIRRNSDGVVRQYLDTHEWSENSDFLWSEGNFACDCNRHIFFASAANESAENRECGDNSYSVRITDERGNVLYEDDDWSPDGPPARPSNT